MYPHVVQFETRKRLAGQLANERELARRVRAGQARSRRKRRLGMTWFPLVFGARRRPRDGALRRAG